MVDAHDSKSCLARGGGSSPLSGTEMKRVLVIVGPTASGKSELAVRLARKLGGEIISADSRQVYKGLNIGTGKVTKREMHGIPHHLLDVADPKKQFNVSDFVSQARQTLKAIEAHKALPIVVGGTGLYIDTLTGKISIPEVPPNKLLRKKLEKLDKEKLFKLLKKKDPMRAKTIDKDNKVRLVRALEIVEALGHVPTPTTLSANSRELENRFVYVGLKPKDLDKRIYKRLVKRIPGMIREAKQLLKQKRLSYRRMQELGLEYRYLALYLQNRINKNELVEKLNVEIRQYAKRQMTWFKRNKKIKWFTMSSVEGFKSEEYKKVEKYVRSVV